MRLKASCEMTLSATGSVPIVAMLRPRSGEAQWILSEKYHTDPFVKAVEYVDAFGNLCQRLLLPAGKLTLNTEVVVEVEDQIAVAPGGAATPIEDLPESALQFLLPSRYCPSDTLEHMAHD